MTALVATHHRIFGQGPRPALAVHCSLGHAAAWRGVGQALSDVLTLTAYDLPSHGKSGDWDGKSDLHTLCTRMALPFLQNPVDLIGHSFGATVALRLAVEHPARARTLTLIEPVFFAALDSFAPETLAAYHTSATPYTQSMKEGDWPRAARVFNRRWGDGTTWQDTPAGARRYMTERMPFIVGQSPMIFDDNAGLLAPGRLEQAAMPCLLLQGSETVPVIDTIHAALAARLPNARRATVPGAGHMAPLTHPAEVAAMIRTLLEVT